jgi:hypothetical protein
VQKGILYKASAKLTGFPNSFSAIDRQLHAHRRRILAPAFTDAALLSMEPHILHHIRRFFDIGLLGGGSSETSTPVAEPRRDPGWSVEVDMSLWGNYLTFDVMGDLAFATRFDMLGGKGSRALPEMVDAALHGQLIVGLPPKVSFFRLACVFLRCWLPVISHILGNSFLRTLTVDKPLCTRLAQALPFSTGVCFLCCSPRSTP